MKSTFIAVFAAVLVLTGCQNYDSDTYSPTRKDILIADFNRSETYMDLLHWEIHLNLRDAELVEINQFEYLFIPTENEEGTNLTYVVKFSSNKEWAHFMRVKSNGNVYNTSEFTGTLVFDFYTQGAKSIHTFEEGVQKEYQVYVKETGSMRRSLLGRSGATEECESMCHVLDCAGRKFEEKHWLSQLQCASSILPCMASLAIQCLDEGCQNSWVNSCNYH